MKSGKQDNIRIWENEKKIEKEGWGWIRVRVWNKETERYKYLHCT